MNERMCRDIDLVQKAYKEMYDLENKIIDEEYQDKIKVFEDEMLREKEILKSKMFDMCCDEIEKYILDTM